MGVEHHSSKPCHVRLLCQGAGGRNGKTGKKTGDYATWEDTLSVKEKENYRGRVDVRFCVFR